MTGEILPSRDIEFYAFRFRFEDSSPIPLSIFSDLVAEDLINSWDNQSPTLNSTIKNIINRKLTNKEGAQLLTGVFVEATNISDSIEIMDITGKIENAKISLDEEIEISETESQQKKLMFKFKRWRIGILPSKGIIVFERAGTNYDQKMQDYLNSWMQAWAAKKSGRVRKSIIIEPFLADVTPSGFLQLGNIGAIEFALSSETLSREHALFNNDLVEMFGNDKNLVVSIEIKAKRGQSFNPNLTTKFIEILKAHESSIEKCSGKKVHGNRKTKSINLIDTLKHKITSIKDPTVDENVLTAIENYLLELYEDVE